MFTSRSRGQCEGSLTFCRLGHTGGIQTSCCLRQDSAEQLLVQQGAADSWKSDHCWGELGKIQPSHPKRQVADGGRISRSFRGWYVGRKQDFYWLWIKKRQVIKKNISHMGKTFFFLQNPGNSLHFLLTLEEELTTLVLHLRAADPPWR